MTVDQRLGEQKRPHDDEAEPDHQAELERARRIENGIRSVRVGHGANCSSVGSVIDTLFVGAVVGGALFAAIAAAMANEKVIEVKPSPSSSPEPKDDDA